MKDSSITRRNFIGSLAMGSLLTACAPSAAPAASPAPQSPASAEPPVWEKQWQELVAAANREGRLVLVTSVGATFRQGVEAFQAAFPQIAVEHSNIQTGQFIPKVLLERGGGIYNYDVLTGPFSSVSSELIPKGAIDPLRPLLFHPDVLDNSKWQDGFETGFWDKGKTSAYAGFWEIWRAVFINTDFVKEADITKFDDLLDPKWKGKIIGGDPQSRGAGYWPATVLRLRRGDEMIKRLWKDQEVVRHTDQRQMMELQLKGQFPISIGAIREETLSDFRSKGIGNNLKYVPMDEMDSVNAGSNVVYVLNRAPHPNAAKLFVNWLLTKEGSTIWSKAAITNSRRLDVPVTNPAVLPDPKRSLVQIDNWQLQEEWAKTQELSKGYLK